VASPVPAAPPTPAAPLPFASPPSDAPAVPEPPPAAASAVPVASWLFAEDEQAATMVPAAATARRTGTACRSGCMSPCSHKTAGGGPASSVAGRVEELLARDLVVLHREQADLVHGRPLPARLVRDVEDEVHGEPVLIRVGPRHLGAVNDVAFIPALVLGANG